jgi:hypothetical protein
MGSLMRHFHRNCDSNFGYGYGGSQRARTVREAQYKRGRNLRVPAPLPAGCLLKLGLE